MHQVVIFIGGESASEDQYPMRTNIPPKSRHAILAPSPVVSLRR
jgi:hypothetical protein